MRNAQVQDRKRDGRWEKEVNIGPHVMSMDQCVWSHLTSAEQEEQIV